MSKIKITTDSVADLSEEMMNLYDIGYFPLKINMDEESVDDGQGIADKIFAFVDKTGKLPKTAARSAAEYKEFFEKNKPAGGELIHFDLSAKMSASYQNASAAAAELEGVYVVDSKSLSSGTGLQILYAVDLVKEGKLTAKEIYEAVLSRVDSVQASFVLDSLDYLHKGGRCSGLVLFITGVLHIKPMIVVKKDGTMGPARKYIARFDKAVDKYVDDILEMHNKPDLKRVFITHTPLSNPEIIERVKNKVLEKYKFENVYVTQAGGTITSHCGKNTIGVLYYNDNSKS